MCHENKNCKHLESAHLCHDLRITHAGEPDDQQNLTVYSLRLSQHFLKEIMKIVHTILNIIVQINININKKNKKGTLEWGNQKQTNKNICFF